MNLVAIQNNVLRRTALVALLVPCAVLGIVIVLFSAVQEYVEAWRGVPEDFMRIWRGVPLVSPSPGRAVEHPSHPLTPRMVKMSE